MITQLDIARRVGLDVSSVNKIINQVPGPKFRKETVAKVRKVAQELGYQGKTPRHQLRNELLEVEAALADLWACVTTSGTPPIGTLRFQEIEKLVLRGQARGQAAPKKKGRVTA